MKLFLITIGLIASVSIFAQEVDGIRFILADLTKAQVQATNADKIIEQINQYADTVEKTKYFKS